MSNNITQLNTIIDIDDTIINEANQIANHRISNGLYNRMGLSYDERLDKAFIGALGEIAFEKFLNRYNITYTTNFRNGTGPDNGDFCINNYSEIIIDVKIAKTFNEPSTGWGFGFPVDQHPEQYDFLVVGYWNPRKNIVEFYGSIPGSMLIGRPTVNINVFSGIRYLTPNKEIRWGELDRDLSFLFNI